MAPDGKSGGEKAKLDKGKKTNKGKETNKGKKDKGKKDKKKSKPSDADSIPDQEHEPLTDGNGDDDDDDQDFGLDGLNQILQGHEEKGGKDKANKKPAARNVKKRPAKQQDDIAEEEAPHDK